MRESLRGGGQLWFTRRVPRSNSFLPISALISKVAGWICLLSFFAVLILFCLGYRSEIGPLAIALFVSLVLCFRGHAYLKGFVFTVWVFVFVTASMFYPAAFGTWYGFDLKYLIVPLIQIIMFGMGTTLNEKDFGRVLTMPWPVFIGLLLQFTVMPLAGYGIAKAFGFPPEIAVGVILIGSVSSGVASNVMAYLANGNVALSVTVTACSTIMAPFMTPFLMKVLAGKLVPINFMAMMLEILHMVIVPIVAGLIANKILYSSRPAFNRAKSLAIMAVASLGLSLVPLLMNLAFLGRLATLRNGMIIGCALIGVVALAKLLISVTLKRPENWMDKALPILSMAGICFIIAIITARSRNQLLTVGLALIGAAILHNSIGYLGGYWLSKLARLDESACRTIAFEVGLQNGGMATGLAMGVLNSPSAALAPAIFGPWMNISGSVLATGGIANRFPPPSLNQPRAAGLDKWSAL